MIFRDLEQKIVNIINDSGMPIDAVYFIMKSIMQEIENEYYEFCRQEDMEAARQAQKELNKEDEKVTTTAADNENKEEGTN